jgi:hypothetical protein
MVAAAEIQLSEEASPLELVQQLIDDRDGELVLHRLGVELTVVDVESPYLVLLTHQQHWRREGAHAGPDDALAKHVIALLLDRVFEQLQVAVRHDGDRWRRRKVDAVVERARWGEARRLSEDVREL